MSQVRNVLAAVGQFPQDDPVLARAGEIARAHRARLTIAHIVEGFTEFDLMPVDLDLIQHQVRLSARESVEAAVARQAVGVAEIDIRIETGSSHLRLTELANEVNADLVVMRAHQSDSILEKIVGSTTDRVIRTACAPVLTVKRPVTQTYQRIVVATDTSEESGAVAAFVAALFPLAGLHLVHVVRIPPQFEGVMLHAGAGQAGFTAYRNALISKAKAYLRAASKRLANRPIRSATRVVVGDPAQSLVRATWSPKVDLIVLGPSNTSMIRQALLGSVTRRVLRAANCDVLICPPTPRDAKQ